MNWAKRIKAARIAGEFTYNDRHLADSWVTCACGEQDSRIPMNSNLSGKEPLDQELFDYGLDFYKAVSGNIPDKAAEILSKIEVRATQILADLGYGK